MIIPKDKLDAAFTLIREDAKGKSCITILILCATDCDSLCASRIFTGLLHDESLPYVHKPLASLDELRDARRLITADTRSVVLINCGGGVPVVDTLELADGVNAYVIDRHLPYDGANLRDQAQVLLFNAAEGLPAEAVTPIDSDSDADSDDADESAADASDRRHRREQRRIARRRQRGLFCGMPAAVMAQKLADEVNRSSADYAWLAIVGLTECYLNWCIDDAFYQQLLRDLRTEVQRHDDADGADDSRQPAEGRIAYCPDEYPALHDACVCVALRVGCFCCVVMSMMRVGCIVVGARN
eukprot:TRINITY_DN457_c0_g3_i1.p1 TRINITY_DN457_c0_g3~~TRINITY_DN457_c0_g3_i1.p1  ORF type:complete len:299 (-),score=79.41 TRINITY_DN457_c0_g3_i1:594-1490(-)